MGAFKNLNRFFSGQYSFVLILFIILFAFRPHDQSLVFIAFWKLFFVIAFISAIYHYEYKRAIAFSLAIPSLLLSWAELITTSGIVFVLSSFFSIVFMWACAVITIRDVTVSAKVTLETLRGVICAYFMIAFAFSFMYYLLEYFLPGSFHLIHKTLPFSTHSNSISQLMYFSFVTLLTIGFGDITPLLDLSQTIVIIEGVIGQFYVAILVAKIVAVYSRRIFDGSK